MLLRIIFILAVIIFIVGVLLFFIRAIIFFRMRDYTDEAAARAFSLMRLGMVFVASSLSVAVDSRITQNPLVFVNVMLVTGLVTFFLLLIFTAQLSRLFAVIAIKNDLKRMKKEEEKALLGTDDAPKVIIVEDPFSD
jgi:FlaA1/EpsC-like NDP-sugar epimerase